MNPIQSLARRWPLDVGGRQCDTVLIAGVGRSGTTWLADLINFDGRYRDLFEPFHPWMVPAAQPLLGHWYQRAADTPPPGFADYVGRVLRGGVRHAWIDRFNRRVVSRRRVVKAIRANLFLGWLAAQHPQVKIILLIRHPAAVARSRLALPAGWEWRPTLAELLAQPRLLGRLSPVQQQLAAAAAGPFEEYLLTWSLSHWIPLTELPAGSVLPVYYERLRSEPAVQLQRVFAFLGRRWDPACLAVHGAPSKTARRQQRDDLTDASAPAPWVRWLDRPQQARLRATLAAFALSGLYDKHGFPSCADEGLLVALS